MSEIKEKPSKEKPLTISTITIKEATLMRAMYTKYALFKVGDETSPEFSVPEIIDDVATEFPEFKNDLPQTSIRLFCEKMCKEGLLSRNEINIRVVTYNLTPLGREFIVDTLCFLATINAVNYTSETSALKKEIQSVIESLNGIAKKL